MLVLLTQIFIDNSHEEENFLNVYVEYKIKVVLYTRKRGLFRLEFKDYILIDFH